MKQITITEENGRFHISVTGEQNAIWAIGACEYAQRVIVVREMRSSKEEVAPPVKGEECPICDGKGAIGER